MESRDLLENGENGGAYRVWRGVKTVKDNYISPPTALLKSLRGLNAKKLLSAPLMTQRGIGILKSAKFGLVA